VNSITTQRVTGGIRVTATIANIGNTTAKASTTRFTLDGSKVLGNVATASLAPGAKTTAVFTWNTSGVTGRHTITVAADAQNALLEQSERNNTAQVSVTAP
jgi:subtilase family serine protease